MTMFLLGAMVGAIATLAWLCIWADRIEREKNNKKGE